MSDLLANPRPILCLDTCDFLDVARGMMRGGLAHARAFGRMLDAQAADPNRLQPVITYLVRHEWEQDLEGVRSEAEKDLEKTDEKIALIDEACQRVGLDFTRPAAVASLPLIQGLIDMAERLMDRAFVLDKDGECIERALDRLMSKRRPSHRKELKDSIHLEHYLKLCHILRQNQFAQHCLFVSANKSDFWQPNDTPRIHPDLAGELQEVGLQFFGGLEEAVGRLGI